MYEALGWLRHASKLRQEEPQHPYPWMIPDVRKAF